MRNFHIYLAAIVMFSATIQCQAQKEWTTAKKKNGIEVQTKEFPGWPIKASRSWVAFNGTQKEVVDYLLEWDKRPDWTKDLIEIKLLHKNKNEFIVYWKYDVPWPAEDRDMITKIIMDQDTEGTIFLRYTGLPNYVPRKDDAVRIERIIGYWRIRQLEENIVEVATQAKTTTGGDIPTWIANMFIEENPYETLKALREHFTQAGM